MERLAYNIQAQKGAITATLASTDWTAPKMHLSTTAITPNQSTLLADFTEASFDGYAADSVTFASPVLDSDGNYYSYSSVAVFTSTGVVTPEVVNSWYLTNTGGTKLLISGALDGGSFSSSPSGSTKELVVKLPFDQANGGQISL